MTYTGIPYYLFLFLCVLLYYKVRPRHQWIVLLFFSTAFYLLNCRSVRDFALFAGTILLSWFFGIVISRMRQQASNILLKRGVLAAGIILSAVPLLAVRAAGFVSTFSDSAQVTLIQPLGLSFYTLQIIAYLSDIYKGRTLPEANILRHALFISFFPQIIQGPIPRHGQLAGQLTQPHRFRSEYVYDSFCMILWGLFLKFMIADKAGIIVDQLFSDPDRYPGMYAAVAGLLYFIQLYADFLSCTTLSRGAAAAFGIELANNFHHPFFAVSVRDFWRRWHISLSTWLKDYIYIPLGGSRHGRLRKYIAITAVFTVSGIWHGGSFRYLLWGLIHAFYEIAGDLKNGMFRAGKSVPDSRQSSAPVRVLRSAFTVALLVPSWILFRADGTVHGVRMILSVFTVFNPGILADGSLLLPGADLPEWCVLILSILILAAVSFTQRSVSVRALVAKRSRPIRFLICFAAVWIIIIFGTYGSQLDMRDFIYGGF